MQLIWMGIVKLPKVTVVSAQYKYLIIFKSFVTNKNLFFIMFGLKKSFYMKRNAFTM